MGLGLQQQRPILSTGIYSERPLIKLRIRSSSSRALAGDALVSYLVTNGLKP